MVKREARLGVVLPVRLRTSAGWVDATIRNVSTRGAMIRLAGGPPGRGEYVEMRRATSVIVGRVVWADRDCCGISTRERIDVGTLRLAPQAAALPTLGADRRRFARADPPAKRDAAIIKRHVETVALCAAVAYAALVVGDTAYHALSHPLATVGAALTAR